MNQMLKDVAPERVKHFLCTECGADTGNFWIAPEGELASDYSMEDLHISDTRCDLHPPIPLADQPPVQVYYEPRVLTKEEIAEQAALEAEQIVADTPDDHG